MVVADVVVDVPVAVGVFAVVADENHPATATATATTSRGYRGIRANAP